MYICTRLEVHLSHIRWVSEVMNLLTKLTRKFETGLLNYKLVYKRSSVENLLTDENGNKTVIDNYRINYLNNHLVQVAEAIE